MIKAIFCDIDGTLLNNDGFISTHTVDMIKQAEEKGIKFIISSGRSFIALLPIYELLGHVVPSICVLGADYYDENQIRIIHNPISKTSVKKIYELSLQHQNYGLSGFGGDEFYISVPIKDFLWNVYKLTELPTSGKMYHWIRFIQHVNSVDDFLSIDIEKLEFHFESEAKLNEMVNELKKLDDINISISTKTNIEITSSNATKGKMVKTICDYYHYSYDDIVTIGDSGNDLSMLKGFKHSIAMGNAHEDVKKECSYVTLDNDHDGVAKVIEYILDHKL